MNTPLGNALLSANALHAGSESFAGRMADGVPLKRQELVDWLAQTRAGTELVEQNVNRFKQLTDGSGRAVRTRFDLREAVVQAWARVQTRLSMDNGRLAYELPDGFMLDGYAEVLEQPLENACVHGFRAGCAGDIRISARRSDDGRLTLDVLDHGVGMPAADVARAFEPFFTTAFGQGGCGVGLFVAHSLVGGSLQLESRPGEGTVATLVLPMRDELRLAA